MQGAGSTTTWPTWSKRKVVVCVCVLGVFVALLAYLTLYPGGLPSPSEERQAYVIAALTDQIRQAYRSHLESVDVQYGRDRLHTYHGSFHLKGVPFIFPFTEQDESILPYYDDKSFDSLLLPELIGGPQRVIELAQAYHRDFPAERAMAFKRTYAGNLPAPLPQAARGMRPTVLVSDAEPYQSNLGRVKAVYAWDAKAREWRLLHRGPLPQPSAET